MSVDYLRSCGAVEAIISGLENHSAGGSGGMDALMTVGGTLLTKIARAGPLHWHQLSSRH